MLRNGTLSDMRENFKQTLFKEVPSETTKKIFNLTRVQARSNREQSRSIADMSPKEFRTLFIIHHKLK